MSNPIGWNPGSLAGLAPTVGRISRSTDVRQCPHCGTPVEGPMDAFCCSGCEMAAAIIRGAGLERYYAQREAFAPRPEPMAGDWAAVPVETDAEGICSARLVVDGLTCASCVWVTERVLERTPGVAEAMVSYATGRATLRWNPAETNLPALARRIAALGYRPRPLGAVYSPDRALILRLGVAAFAAMNIMLLAASIYAGWWDAMAPRFTTLFHWTILALATPVVFWCATPFFVGAWAGLRHRLLHIDVPIALGIIILYGQGLIATIRGEDSYLDSLVMLIALLLAGRVLEIRGRRRAAEAATALIASVPRTARRSSGSRVETIPVEQLSPGDLIDVGAGEEVAADGVVVAGAALLKVALITGESEPIRVATGAKVVAGALVVDGSVSVWVSAVGEETVVRQMGKQLEAAAERGAQPTSADRIAPWFTAATLLAAGLTLGAWWVHSGLPLALARTVAVLVVACPCALALAGPLSSAAGLGAAARRGLLLRSSDALLDLANVDLVALDKTGTVTTGELAVVSAQDDVLRIAAGLERYSTHPIARAIIREATHRGIPLPEGRDVRETAGHGISGLVDGAPWTLRGGAAGEVILVGDAGGPGTIRLGDTLREDSPQTIAALKADGVEVVMLSGDHTGIAQRIAREAGTLAVHGGMDPEAKAKWIQARRREGRRVLFAGDGINDGPALAAADVGIAMGSGAASSILVADGVVGALRLAPILAGFRASRAARHAIRLSQRRSIVYNILAVGAAAAGLINPLTAAVLMPLSSGLVIWQASRVEAAVRRAAG